MIDLHTHSIASDGSMTPAALARHAKVSGLSLFALTDHDTTAGLREAEEASAACGIRFVRGIELSAKSDYEMHIVGLDIDPATPSLQSALARALVARRERSEETCFLLNRLGFPVTTEEAEALAPDGIVGRAHYARLLVDRGYVPSVKEAFDRYLSRGRPAYSQRQALLPEECISLIAEAGGISVLAHLHLTGLVGEELERTVRRLGECGLCAVEGYYSEYTPEMQKEYIALADRLGLGISGGTDFHGNNKPHIQIGRGRGNLSVPDSVWDELQKHRKNRNQ